MIDYAQAVKTVIEGSSYVLEQLEDRIDQLWVEGKLTDEQRAELKRLAAEGASDQYQIDVVAMLANHEQRLYELEHPVEQFPVWQDRQVSERGVVYRFDVTGDGELDLVRYDGGRTSTSLSIGKIEGWHMLDRELNVMATITRDANGGYVITPVEATESDSDGLSDDIG